MSRRAALAWAAAVALAAAGPARAAAQGPGVEVTRPAFDARLQSATPWFTVVARDAAVPTAQVSVVIQVATQATFGASIVFADTAAGDSADFVPVRPLPSGVPLFWRGIALIDGVAVATSPVTGPRLSARWLELLAPDAPNGIILDSRRPTFVWRSAPVVAPPGPWRYDLTITNVGTGASFVVTDLADTTYVPALDLDANTSYRWSVRAHLATGDQLRVASLGSFVIAVREQPLVTLLYQNFPNPFPTPSSQATCVWFDLAREADVRLEVLTLRGDRVRVIYPSRADFPQLRAGRYGRATVGSDTGCDPRFTWDGRSDAGERASPGVYLLRLRAGRQVMIRKILYPGQLTVRLVTVGTGTISLAPDRVRAGHLVEAGPVRLLMDCGSGVVQRLAELGLDWWGITHVAFTHFHVDHVADFATLVMAWKWARIPGRTEPLVVVGPAGTRALLARVAAAFGDWVAAPGFPLEVLEVAPGGVVELGGGVRLSAWKVPHTPESVAYSIEHGRRRIVYTGDTGYDPALAEWATGCDVLLCECSLPDRLAIPQHLTPEQCGALAAIARPKLLALTHLYPPVLDEDIPGAVRRRFAGDVVIARDGWSTVREDLSCWS